MVKRRKVLLGMGSLAAGGAAAMGTGAFSSVQAQRGIDVNVAGDYEAFLQLTAPDTLENGEYATGPQEGASLLTLQFDADAETNGGKGVNADAMNRFDNVFKVTNQGTQEVDLFIKDSSLSDNQKNRIRFYHGSSRETLEDGGADDDNDGKQKVPLALGAGNSESVGVEIDTTGMTDPEQLVNDGTITIYTES